MHRKKLKLWTITKKTDRLLIFSGWIFFWFSFCWAERENDFSFRKPVAPVAPVVPPTKSTPEDVRNEFYDKIRFLVDQQSREDEEEPDSSDDNDESPDDPDLYSDDVQNAFAAYEQVRLRAFFSIFQHQHFL